MKTIQLLILDADGVLTDGSLTMGGKGEILKAFYVRDGVALKSWRQSGGKVAILSGRSDPSVGRRAAELGIECVRTGVCDKLAEYEAILALMSLQDASTAYIGDDLPDLPILRRCGFSVAVADAAPAVKRSAHYVTRAGGGKGAVAEVVALLLRK